MYVPGWVSHVELSWELPDLVHGLERLASFSRLILFDKRGTGMSDPVPVAEPPTLEQRMDDVRAVLDAVGSERAVVFGASEGGNASCIPGARFVEFPGADHSWWTEGRDAILDEIEELVTGVRPAPRGDRVLATVLFTDLVGSTAKLSRLGDRDWTELLARHHAAVRRELEHHRGREIDTAGDGFLASFDGPARAIRCALAIRHSVEALGLELRCGIHTGECEQLGEKMTGIAVHTGARIASLAGAGDVLVSATVRDLVSGSGIEFDDRGEHELKGVGSRRVYAVTGA